MVALSEVLGRYRLVERLGAGGMAVVYRAIIEGPRGFQRSVVVKRVRPELARDPHFVNGLLDEARLAGLLHHPGIAQVFELAREGDEHFLVMEYVDGANLATVLGTCQKLERRMPPGLVCFMVRELAAALSYAHELADESGRPLEVVHRDVSPSNIMLSAAGAVKLLDFGIAKAASTVREETRSGVIKGKLSYLSPEQADGQTIDHRSDLFSLGIVMHEALTGRRLFRGNDDLQTLKLVREARVAPLSSLVEGTPAELERIVAKLLARDPAARYASGDELATELTPLVHGFGADAPMLRQFVGEIRVAIVDDDGAPERHTAPVTAGAESHGELRPLTGAFAGRRRSLVAFGLAAAAGLAVVVWAIRAPESVPAIRSAPAPSAPSLSPPRAAAPVSPPAVRAKAPAARASIRLRVTGTRDAEVLVDGRTIGRIPVELSLPSRTRPVQVKVRARGYQGGSFVVAGDRDGALDATLRRSRGDVHETKSEIRDPFSRLGGP